MRGPGRAEADERAPVTRPAPAPDASERAGAEGQAGDQAGLLGLQATAGNAAVAELLRAPGGSGPCACGGSGGDCACEGNDGQQGSKASTGGEPLDPAARDFLESRFGRDLGAVRVHTGPEAAASADAADARAYTVGTDIVFAAGAYQPGSAEGRRLLAHEVAHTLQPETPPTSPRATSRPGDAAEVAAARAADFVMGGTPPPAIGARPVGVLHRQAEGGEGEEATEEPVADVSGEGPESQLQAMANVSLPGQTDAMFSSSFHTQGARQRRGDAGCNTVSGTLVNTFTVTTSVTLPSVPSGLTECQRTNAQRFIDTILAPHEQEHVAAFNTYNGTSNAPFTVTVCAGDDLNALVQAEHDTIAQTRKDAAQALSDALDPFNVEVDIDEGCEAPAE